MTGLDRTTPPPVRPPEDFRLPRPERLTTSNGMPLGLLRAGTEDVLRFDLLVAAGQQDQDLPLQANFACRMLREGTSETPAARIAERLDFYGAWLELTTSVDYSYVTLYTPGRHFANTLPLVAEMVQAPAYPARELALLAERNRRQFLVNGTRVATMARRRLDAALFGMRHPFSGHVEETDYGHLTPDILRTFHGRHYHSGNCSAYLSGRVTPEAVRCVERCLGDTPWGRVAPKATRVPVIPHPETGKRYFEERADARQDAIGMGCLSIDRRHPDYMKAHVLVTLLGGYFGSRLMTNIREEKGYTYGIGAAFVAYPGLCTLVISTETSSEHVEATIREVYHEMSRLREEEVTPAELERVRNYLQGDLSRAYEGALALPDAWIYAETAGLGEDFFDRSLEAVRTVTSADLLALARKYFCKESLIEVVAGKKV